MALSIGELTGYLDLDAGPFEKAIGSAFDKMGSKKWQVAGAAAGVAAGTAIAAGLVTAMDTEKLNNKMSASLGLTKTQSATAGKAAGQLYADNYGSSMEDVTGAVEGVMSSIKGMRGASQADIQAVTKDVLNLGSAFEVDVGRTSQIVGQMITSGIATDAKNAADLLAGTLSKVPKNVREDIMDAVDEYSPFMATLGMKGEEAMGILAASSEKGMYGIDKTGDALKEFTIRSTDMSKATGGAYKALGMNQEKMTARLLAGGPSAKKAFGEIIAGLQTMKDPVEQSQAALALFGTPLEDLSVTEIPKFLGAIDPMGDKFASLKGKAAELDGALGAGASNGWEKFKRGAETAMSSIGEKVLPILTPIIQNLGQWAPVIGPAVVALAAFAGVIWAVSAAMTAFTVIKGIIDVIKAWTVVQWLLNTAMFANPITWIIVGIVALIAIIVLLVMNWQQVVDFLTVVWGGFINWCKQIIDGFVVWWNQVWAGVGAFISSVWNNIVNWVRGAINNVWQTIVRVAVTIKNYWDNFWLQIGAKIGEIWGGIKKGVQDGIENVVSFVKGLPDKVLGFFSGAGTLLLNAGGNIIKGFLDGLKSGFEDVKNFVGGIGDWIAKNKGPKAYDLALLIPAGGWIMDGLQTGIEKSMPSLKKTLGGVSATIAGGVSGGTVGLSGVPSAGYAPATAAAAPAGGVHIGSVAINQQRDPNATFMEFSRRVRSLTA